MKLETFWLVVIALVLAGCATPAEIVKETVIVEVTQPPLPTYTPYPTYTPVPEPTATPTATPMPTPIGPVVEILSHQSYVDGKLYYLVGEIQNSGNAPVQFVKIVATLYDKDGAVSGTGFTYTEIGVIPPGGKSPFHTATDDWEGTTDYKLQLEWSEGGEVSRQDLEILSHESIIDGKLLRVRGEVKNTGDIPAEFVKLIITLYDAGGNVVGMGFTYTELGTIPAGGTSPFSTATDHWPGFDHYEIQVHGR